MASTSAMALPLSSSCSPGCYSPMPTPIRANLETFGHWYYLLPASQLWYFGSGTYSTQPRKVELTMGEAVRHALNNYAIFRGRTTRRNFWFFYLFTILMNIPTSILDRILFAGHAYTSNLAGLLLIVPSIAAGIRRMHDVGKRGWWLLFPFVNIYFLVQPSGPLNQFEL